MQAYKGFRILGYELDHVQGINDESEGDLLFFNDDGIQWNVEHTSIFSDGEHKKVNRANFVDRLEKDIEQLLGELRLSYSIDLSVAIINGGILSLGAKEREALLSSLREELLRFCNLEEKRFSFSLKNFPKLNFRLEKEEDLGISQIRCHIYQPLLLKGSFSVLTPPDNDIYFESTISFLNHLQNIVLRKSSLRKAGDYSYVLFVDVDPIYSATVWFDSSVFDQEYDMILDFCRFTNIFLFGDAATFGLGKGAEQVLLDIGKNEYVVWDYESEDTLLRHSRNRIWNTVRRK